MARAGIESLDAFDDCFGGLNTVFNWVQDFEMELHNAGIEDQRFVRERIALCETMIRRFPNGKLSIHNFKSALAESHFQLGDRETGDRLFRRWIDEDPRNGPWVTWSDCYWIFAAKDNKDAARAERILKEGLAVPGVEDRTLLLSRLATIYEETARPQDAQAAHAEIARLSPPKKPPIPPKTAPALAQETRAQHENLENVHPRRSLLGKPKVGRNEPCPCGSGKKFKKCCGG